MLLKAILCLLSTLCLGTELPKPPNCGISFDTSSAQQRILGGYYAKAGQFPWMAFVLVFEYKNGELRKKNYCGAYIIHERWAISSARCFKSGFDVVRVRVGVIDTGDMDQFDPLVDVWDEKVFMHPNITASTLVNNIALIKLSHNVTTLNRQIAPICLPISAQLRNESFTNYQGFLAGWGATTPSTSTRSRYLKAVQVPILSNNECQKVWGPVIDDSTICAGGMQFEPDRENKNGCSDDGGGPLFVAISEDGSEYFYAVGVFSFMSVCTANGHPGGYVRITVYLDWIQSIINNN